MLLSLYNQWKVIKKIHRIGANEHLMNRNAIHKVGEQTSIHSIGSKILLLFKVQMEINLSFANLP